MNVMKETVLIQLSPQFMNCHNQVVRMVKPESLAYGDDLFYT